MKRSRARPDLGDRDEPIGAAERQRSQRDRVDDGERHGAGSDGKRKDNAREERRATSRPQSPNRVTQEDGHAADHMPHEGGRVPSISCQIR